MDNRALDVHNGALGLLKLSVSAGNASGGTKRSLAPAAAAGCAAEVHGQQPPRRKLPVRSPARRLEAFSANIASLWPLPAGSAGLNPTPPVATGSSLPVAQAMTHRLPHQPSFSGADVTTVLPQLSSSLLTHGYPYLQPVRPAGQGVAPAEEAGRLVPPGGALHPLTLV